MVAVVRSDRILLTMNTLEMLLERLRAVERLYESAAGIFIERKSKIDAGEEPYQTPPFDPETDYPEPPFLEEWIEANEFQNIIGQACISIIQSCLRDYLRGVLERSGITPSDKNRGKNGWFGRYVTLFADVYHINWAESPVSAQAIEEINLVRNDIQHGRPAPIGLSRYQDVQYEQRFPLGLFTDDYELRLRNEHNVDSHPRVYGYAQVCVSPDALKESIRRVKSFCEFIENRTRH
jgi:hypothetical protein